MQIFQTDWVDSSTKSSLVIQNYCSIDYPVFCHNLPLVIVLICAQIHQIGVVWINRGGMCLRLDWDGSGVGRIGDRGRDGASESGEKGGEDHRVYDGRRFHVVVAALVVVLPNPGFRASHPFGFVAS